MPQQPIDSQSCERHPPEVLSTLAELKQWVTAQRRADKTIGVVPTMGALHQGHLSLAEASLQQADVTIVTIFVNPTQFAPTEDLSKYPRTLPRDLELLSRLGRLTVFAPTDKEIYPEGCSTSVLPPKISKTLEGEKRPTHFAGVATVVLKLLNMTGADYAFFGQKDFQQQLVVRQMVEDLNVPTEIVVCPIVREPDGLAMSSRNVYLSPEERAIATVLNQTLQAAEAQIRGGQRDSFELIVEMRQMLIDGGVTSVDYAVVADPRTLETPDQIGEDVVLLVAAIVGKTRLIDNRVVTRIDH
jgi:pantoate--beta-alanine ligase